jgi:hypothetical protein
MSFLQFIIYHLQRELIQQAENLRNTIEITKTKALERRELEEKTFAEEVRTHYSFIVSFPEIFLCR